MRILHSAIVTPRRCGLYETTRELVAAERALGHDAFIVDPQDTDLRLDRGVPILPRDKCLLRPPDVIVEHSGLTPEMRKAGAPLIHVRHGRPHSTFCLDEKLGIFRYLCKHGRDYDAVVTFWPEHQDFWARITRREVDCISPPVDLAAWTPDGPVYNFKRPGVNVVVADGWRADVDPFEIVKNLSLYAQVHVVGTTTEIGPALREMAKAYGFHVYGWVEKGMDALYRGADVVVTPNQIATRCLREAMACGCPVVGPPGCQWTPFRTNFSNAESAWATVAKAANQDRLSWRKIAEDNFSHLETGRQFLEVVERVVECESPAEQPIKLSSL